MIQNRCFTLHVRSIEVQTIEVVSYCVDFFTLMAHFFFLSQKCESYESMNRTNRALIKWNVSFVSTYSQNTNDPTNLFVDGLNMAQQLWMCVGDYEIEPPIYSIHKYERKYVYLQIVG